MTGTVSFYLFILLFIYFVIFAGGERIEGVARKLPVFNGHSLARRLGSPQLKFVRDADNDTSLYRRRRVRDRFTVATRRASQSNVPLRPYLRVNPNDYHAGVRPAFGSRFTFHFFARSSHRATICKPAVFTVFRRLQYTERDGLRENAE